MIVKTLIMTALIVTPCLTQAAIVYQDTFDGDGLGTNTGIGGGAGNNTISNAVWSDTGDATYDNMGTGGGSRAALYSVNSFDLSDGFTLTVEYSASRVNLERFGFGLVREDIDVSTSTFNALFVNGNFSAYALGLNVSSNGANPPEPMGVTLNDNGSFSLISSDQVISTGTHTLELTVNASSEFSYSIDGATASTGTIAGGLDLTQGYHFVAYAQDDNSVRSLQSVTLETIPEPTTSVLIAMFGGGLLFTRRRSRL